MTFSYQARGTAQALAASSEDAARTFVYKHLGVIASKMPPLRVVMSNAEQEAVQSMVLELLANNQVLRAASPTVAVIDADYSFVLKPPLQLTKFLAGLLGTGLAFIWVPVVVIGTVLFFILAPLGRWMRYGEWDQRAA